MSAITIGAERGVRSSVGRPARTIIVTLLSAILVAGLGFFSPGSFVPAHATGQVVTFCDSSYGTTTWTGRNPEACGGTLRGYYDSGTYIGSVNETELVASGTPRNSNDLDSWCSAHSFWCTIAGGGVWYIFSRLV
jgi:hypothetical protein